ncbi:MAG: NnrS family protein [Alphaproteobacteria bacterium]
MLSIFDIPFWGRGFRPFFLMGALYGALTIAVWGGFYAGYVALPLVFLDAISWHAHEMIYGFSMAIVAGFLLTAVANWTGGAPVRQIRLAGLSLLWLLGRIVMNFDLGLPEGFIIVSQVLFIPALAIALALPLLHSWNKRNFIFLLLLSFLFGCDLWFLLSTDMTALHAALMVIIMMVSLIGGRIIPSFTVAALRRKGLEAYQTDQGRMDAAALLSLLAVTLSLVFASETIFLGLSAAISALLHLLRMRFYHTLKTGSDPLLWILHAGYLWLVIGLALLSLTGFGLFSIPAVIHALTAGCIGSMILGMICRVTLGHTGRVLRVSRLTALSFILIQLAAVIRVFGPILLPSETTLWIVISATLWSLCFVAYLISFGPFLFQPRPDGNTP